MEKMITFWLHIESWLLISVHDTKNGLECNCICPKCEEKLVKKWHWESLVQWKRRAHFAHFSWKECEWAYESTIHKLAKQIISKEMKIFLPSYSNKRLSLVKLLPAKEVIFTKWVRIEEDQILLKRRPDAIWVLENWTEIWIEFAYSHFVSWEKLNTIIQKGIECIEIDLRWIELNEDILRKFLINQSSSRKWINHPLGDIELWNSNRLVEQRISNEKNIGMIRDFKLGSSSIQTNERYNERDFQFEKEWRITLQRSFWEKIPRKCPNIDRVNWWCDSCKYNLAIYPSPDGYSEIACAYWAKKKNLSMNNNENTNLNQLDMNF